MRMITYTHTHRHTHCSPVHHQPGSVLPPATFLPTSRSGEPCRGPHCTYEETEARRGNADRVALKPSGGSFCTAETCGVTHACTNTHTCTPDPAVSTLQPFRVRRCGAGSQGRQKERGEAFLQEKEGSREMGEVGWPPPAWVSVTLGGGGVRSPPSDWEPPERGACLLHQTWTAGRPSKPCHRGLQQTGLGSAWWRAGPRGISHLGLSLPHPGMLRNESPVGCL